MPTLTDLPAELLHRICSIHKILAAEENNAPAYWQRPYDPYLFGLVHRSLVPWARQTAFKDVTVRTYLRLEKLMPLVRSSGNLATSVRSLNLAMKRERAEGAEPTALVNRDNGRPPAAFEMLLAALPNLNKLVVDNSHRLIQCVLSQETVENGSLNRLKKLTIKDQKHSWSHPYDASRFKHILTLPHLDYLEIDSSRYSELLWVTETSKPLLPLFKGTLSLRGRLGKGVANFVASFSSLPALILEDLTLAGAATTSQLVPLLESLHQPNTLQFLSLKQEHALPLEISSIAFSAFTSLQDLHLYQQTCSTSVIRALSSAPTLERIFLHRNSVVDAADLDFLVGANEDGTRRLPKLHRLVLNNIKRMEIHKVERTIWPGAYTVEGILHLVSVGEKAGVVIKGELVGMARKKTAM